MKVRNVLSRDAIPSIDEPAFAREYFGEPDDEVIVLEGARRAYPIRILSYHEVVNDVVDGVPLAITWCPICWSSVVYDRTVGGRTLTFGMSGKLADDALVMYDRQTGSEWKQPTGTAIAGELTGRRLEAIPTAIMTYARFAEEFPDGQVLQPVRGSRSNAGPSPRQIYDIRPYERYVDRESFGLYGMRGEGDRREWARDDLDAKTVVLGVEHGDATVGYPVPRVAAAGGVVTDTVGGLDIVVLAAGERIHAYENPGYEFRALNGRIEADGTTWDPDTGESADGRRLPRVPAIRLFAFAWQDAHGPEAIYE